MDERAKKRSPKTTWREAALTSVDLHGFLREVAYLLRNGSALVCQAVLADCKRVFEVLGREVALFASIEKSNTIG